jgi:hypothetical protein
MTHSYSAQRFIWISDWLRSGVWLSAAYLDVCFICTGIHTIHVCVYILVCIRVYFCRDVCKYSLSLFAYLFVECFLLNVTSLYRVLEFTLQCIYCTVASSTPYMNTFWTFRNLFTTLNQKNAQYSSLDIYIMSH